MSDRPDPAVEEAPVLLRRGLDRGRADVALLALQALAIPALPVFEPGVGVAIAVPAGQAERARAVLDDLEEEQDGDAEAAAAGVGENSDRRPWFDRSALAVVGLLGVLVAAYLATAGLATEATWQQMLRAGAVEHGRVEQGEAWRLATAILLHFDLAHLLANAATLLFVGPLLAREVGGLRLLLVFAGAGIAGNLASFALAPTLGLKAGASGGIAGLLGALAGESLGAPTERAGRYRRWQVLAALAAVYALLVGASPKADHVAHAAGLVAGVMLGRLVHPRLRTRGVSPPSPPRAPPRA